MKNFSFNLLLVCCCISSVLCGQNDILNYTKYWYYKTRLNNDFIKVGIAQGESVPFNQRGNTQKGYPTATNSNTELSTGDALSSMGIYMAALATEYALLKANNQNTDSVKHELFCVLNALNRIDDFSEPLWAWAGGTHVPLNGFMVRDDIDAGFLYRNYDHFNYYSHGIHPDLSQPQGVYPNNQNADRGFCSQMLIGQNKMASSYSKLQTGVISSPDNITMSQDHVVTLLIGLNLINKYVDYSATDNGAVFGYEGQNVSSIKQEAWNITDRLAQHFKNDVLWNLRNPVTGQIVQPGGVTTAIQYGMAESMCRAENFNTNLPDPFIPLINPFGSLVPFTCNYNTPIVQTVGENTWEVYMQTATSSMDNAGFKVHLLATGNCGWKYGQVNATQTVCGWVSNNVCNNLPFPLSTLCNIVTSWVCNQSIVPVPGYTNLTESYLNAHINDPYGIEAIREQQPRKYDLWHAALLHKVLFPNNNTTYSAYLSPIKGALDNAPCEGPYNFGQFARPQFEWTSPTRIEHTADRQDWNEPDNGWNNNKGVPFGENSGTDYMLIHNLYRLTVGSSTPFYQDLSHRYINIPLPADPSCTKPSHCVIRAFETITADNTVNSNGDIDYKAGKYVDLKPGFYVAPGADLHAYIQPANCSSGSAGLRHSQTDSARNYVNTFTGYDDMGDQILTHYVQYANTKDSTRENPMSSIIPPPSIKQPMPSKEEAFKGIENLIGKTNNFNVFPNPASDLVTIEFTLDETENARLMIINELGETVSVEEIKGTKIYRKILDVTDIQKGIYLIRLYTDKNRNELKKLTIQ